MGSIISYISSLDYPILEAVQSIGPKWEPVASFISHGVGSYVVMFVAFFIILFFIDKWRVAFELFIITALSFGVLVVLKYYFGVDRPAIIDASILAYDFETGFALPSGHALMSVVILGWVALRHPKSIVIQWGTIVLVILIGISRVYLGVHYPTQVVAGWLFGILLLYIFYSIDKRLWSPFQKRLD